MERISDDILRNIAGERDRLANSKLMDVDPRTWRDILQTSSIAAELLARRAAERGSAVTLSTEEVNHLYSVMAHLGALDDSDGSPRLWSREIATLERLIAASRVRPVVTATPPAPSDVSDALRADAAPTTPPTASLIDDHDREILETWWVRYSAHRPAVSVAIRKLLDGRDLSTHDREHLVLFVSHNDRRWPITCEAVARVLDGVP